MHHSQFPRRFEWSYQRVLAMICVIVGLIVVAMLVALNSNDPDSPGTSVNQVVPSATPGGAATSGTLPTFPSTPSSSPAWQVAMNAAVGPPDALVTIIEFGAYGCTFCRKFYQAKTIENLLARHPQDVRYIYIIWPVIHANDPLATEAVYCAVEQGDFYWRYHDALFDMTRQEFNQFGNPSAYVILAEQLGLDKERFSACLSQGTYTPFVWDLIQAGANMGLRWTPTFFVNGTLVGSNSLEEEVENILVANSLDLSPNDER